MNDKELTDFIYLFFGVGIVFVVYEPAIFSAILPFVALLGAFYLVWGTISHVTSGFTGLGRGRQNDWWGGIAIMLVLILVFGQRDLATGAFYMVLNIVWSVLTGIPVILRGL